MHQPVYTCLVTQLFYTLQVEVAVEITVETTTTTSSATRFSSRKDIADARPLISRVSTAPVRPGANGASRVERMVTGVPSILFS